MVKLGKNPSFVTIHDKGVTSGGRKSEGLGSSIKWTFQYHFARIRRGSLLAKFMDCECVRCVKELKFLKVCLKLKPIVTSNKTATSKS